MSRYTTLVWLVLLLTACGEAENVCVDGDVAACFCEGGVGSRLCTDGEWAECGSCSTDSIIDLGPIGNRAPGSLQGLALLPGQLDHAGIDVELNGIGGFEAFTSMTGLYSMEDVPAGFYTVTATSGGYADQTSDVFEVLPNELVMAPTVVLADFTGSFSGTVLLSDSEDHAGTVVSIQGTSHAVLTDELGRWAIEGVLPGSYSVSAGHDEYFPTGRADQLISGGRATTVPTMVLSKEPGKVSGEVVFEADDRSGVVIAATAEWDERIVCTGVTNDVGFFETADCTPGLYTVLASHPDYLTNRLSGIPVVAGETAEVTIPLTTEGQRPTAIEIVSGDNQTIAAGDQSDDIVVRVTDASGAPAGDVLVLFGSDFGPEVAFLSPNAAITDREGKATARLVMTQTVGSYTFEVSSPEIHGTVVGEFEIVPGDPVYVSDLVGPDDATIGTTIEISYSATDAVGNYVYDFMGCTNRHGEQITSSAEDGRARFEFVMPERSGIERYQFGILSESDGSSEGPRRCNIYSSEGVGEVQVLPGPPVDLFEVSELHDFSVEDWVAVGVQVTDEVGNGIPNLELVLDWQNDEGETIQVEASTEADGFATFYLEIDRTKPRTVTVSFAELDPEAILIPPTVGRRLDRLTIGASDCISLGVFPSGEIGERVIIPVAACDNTGELNAVRPTLVAHSSGSGTSVVDSIEAEGSLHYAIVTIGTLAGGHWLTASAEEDGATVSDRIDFVVQAGTPRYIDAISGDDQPGIDGTALQEPFVVRLTDLHDNPVPNAEVVWTAVSGSVASDPYGEAFDELTSVTTSLGQTRMWGVPLASGDPLFTASYETSDGPIEQSFAVHSVVDGRSQLLTTEAGALQLPAHSALSVYVEAHYDEAPTVDTTQTHPRLHDVNVTTGHFGATWLVNFDNTTIPGRYEFALAFGDTITNTVDFGFGLFGSSCDEDSHCLDTLTCSDQKRCIPEDWVVVESQSTTLTVGSEDPRTADPAGPTHSPAHEVMLSFDLLVHETEVTRAEWASVTGDTYSDCSDCPVTWARWTNATDYLNRWSLRDGLDQCYTYSGCEEFDDVSTCSDVSWDFNCTGYRLPTEPEWEYLARAGTVNQPWPCGSNPSCLTAEANCDPTAPIEVGSLQSNDYGLYDMIGNAPEWVWDPFAAYVERESPVSDPSKDRIGEGDDLIARGQGCGRVYWRYHRDSFTIPSSQAGFRAVTSIRGEERASE